MATVQSIIDSARYDLVDYVDGVGLGIEFDDTELLNYMNRMVGILDSNLVSLNSDLTEDIAINIETTTGQNYVDLSSTLNSGNWLDIRSVWIGSNQLEKVSLAHLRHSRMFRKSNATPTMYALSGRKILFETGASAITDLADGYVSTDWANEDINTYDETTDLSITATVAAQYCKLPVLSFPTTVGTKYRMKYTLSSVGLSWEVQSFDSTQSMGSIITNATGGGIEFVAETTGGLRLASETAYAAGNFSDFKLYNWSDCLTIFYDKKTAALTLTSSMPYNDTFNEFLREMLVLCAKAKKEGIISRVDGVFNSLFKQRVMQEEISRSFIPRNYNYMEF